MSDIKLCFESRYGSDGVIMEADFGQLEVVALAFLSGDKQLREDILNKVDIHSVNAAKLFKRHLPEFLSAKASGDPLTLNQRKLAKQLGFQLQYGAGAKSMADKNGISKAVAQRFIDNYYARYPGVKEWQDWVAKDVNTTRAINNSLRTEKGFPVGEGTYISITNRRYYFREFDNPFYDKNATWKTSNNPTNFSPTQLKNYPVQGFATGDIVPMMLGKVFRLLLPYRKDIKMINTVHDSLVFDCRITSAHTFGRLIKEELERAPQYLKEEFGIDFDLPLEVEVKVGPSWGELKKLDL